MIARAKRGERSAYLQAVEADDAIPIDPEAVQLWNLMVIWMS